MKDMHAGVLLRPYQEQCLEAIVAKLKAGVLLRLLVAMATGTGKTVIFSQLPKMLPGRWLVLAHRTELLEQAQAKLWDACPWSKIGIEQASSRASSDSTIIVASVQTLQGKRLKSIDPSMVDGIICDECHHATASTYMAIFNHFGLFSEGNKKPLVGFTATPKRGDSIGLSTVFQHIAYEYGIQAGIVEGHLAPLTGWRIGTGTDINGVATRAGDFATGQLAAAIDTPQRNKLIVDSYLEYAAGRRALAFAASVEHSRHLSEAFKARGVISGHIDGKTPPSERREALERFAGGEIHVMSNCGVLTEGYDDPGVSCILMARPTQSGLLYAQIVGRGTRNAPDKENCMVLDFADSSKRNTICSVASLVGLPPALNLMGRSAAKAKAAISEMETTQPWLNLSELNNLEELKSVSSRIEFFDAKIPREIAKFSRFVWLKLSDGSLRLSLPDREIVMLCPTRLDTWECFFHSKTGIAKLFEESDVGVATKWAEDTIRGGRPDVIRIIDRFASWRKKPASDKQMMLLRKLGVQVPYGVNKGMAANIITIKFSEKKVNK